MSDDEKPKSIRAWDRLPDSPNCVTVFGAGIAGMTAAHELVERGFQVQVWEPQKDQRHPEKGCDVGGLARTQWSSVRWPLSKDADLLPNQRLPFANRRTEPINHIRQRIYLKWSPGVLLGEIRTKRLPDAAIPLDPQNNELSIDCYYQGNRAPIISKTNALPESEGDSGAADQNEAGRNAAGGLSFWDRLGQRLWELETYGAHGDDGAQLQGRWKQTRPAVCRAPHAYWPTLIIETTGAVENDVDRVEVHCWPRPKTSQSTAGGATGDDTTVSESAAPRSLRPPGGVSDLKDSHDSELDVAESREPRQALDDELEALRAALQEGTYENLSCTVQVFDTSTDSVVAETLEQLGTARLQALLGLISGVDPDAIQIQPRGTFAELDLAYDVTLPLQSGPLHFRLEIQLRTSRRPDWADILVEWHGTPKQSSSLEQKKGRERDDGEGRNVRGQSGGTGDGQQRVIRSAQYRRLWKPRIEDIRITSDDIYSPEVTRARDEGNALEKLKRRLREIEPKVDGIYVEVTSRLVVELSDAEKDRRVNWVRRLLEQPGEEYGGRLLYRWIDAFPYARHDDLPEDVEVVVAFRPRERWLPGEHGYRFFPSFYHHLFDTMRRTPELDIEDKPTVLQAQELAEGFPSPEPVQYVESGTTVFDNLQPASSYLLAFTRAQRASQLSRFPINSFEEAREYLRILFGPVEEGGFGFDPRDAARLTLKVLQFATSCEARRQDYEKLSWWDYLDADTFGERAQHVLQRLPEALVAMDAKESDARTQWVPFIQLLLDQVRKDTYRDGVLRGPTNDAWLNPWRRYLEAQGVEFINGELEGFDLVEVGGEYRVHPRVICFDDRYSKDALHPPIRPGYFVLAVSAEEARRLGEEYARVLAEAATRFEHLDAREFDRDSLEDAWPPQEDSDLASVRTLGGDMPLDELDEELAEPRPNSDFRHFAGIQYYFAEDVYWIDGHVYYPDSEWSITSVSQARFWEDKMDWEHGYRGILSAIVGAWDVRSKAIDKTAWECTEEELAEEVWRQIREGIEGLRSHRNSGVGRFSRRTPHSGALPEPLYWHLDENVGGYHDERDKHAYLNRTPFLIATPGRFSERPGSLENGYTIEHGFVLAGYYTQTFTRVPSMEAANESARHAVNAILAHLERRGARGHQYRRSPCDIWNPEDREIDDFHALRQLDANLHARGRPHLMEILDLDEFSQHVFRGGARDPFDPLRILSRLRSMYRSGGSNQ